MNAKSVLGSELCIRAPARLALKPRHRQCQMQRRPRRRCFLGTPVVPPKKKSTALKAASLGVSLAKDIYCPEPWWSRNSAPNMLTIHSPEQLLNALKSAGHRLVVIDFYAKWCRSCRALYPKLSQICRSNPEILVLKVDWDDNLELCQVMGVKALPFFHFYQSPFGCIESFTISVSRVRKLKDTIAAYKVPFETQISHLTGIGDPRFSLELEMDTVSAQLNKIEQIFCIT